MFIKKNFLSFYSDLICSRYYYLSTVTGVSVGISITEDLTLIPVIRLSNKNDLSIDLSEDAVISLFSPENWNRHLSYFNQINEDIPTTSSDLDTNTKILYSKVFNRKTISVKSNQDITISFYDTTCRKFKLFSFAILTYFHQLKNQVDIIRSAIPIARTFFEKHFYVSTNDLEIANAVLHDSNFMRNDIIHIELALIAYKKFINSIDKSKQQQRANE